MTSEQPILPWETFSKLHPESSWAELEALAQQALASTNSSRPFLSQREKLKVHFDPLPYCLDANDWQIIVDGLKQRTRLLNATLEDLYGPQEAIKAGLINIREVFALKNYTLCSHGSTGMSLPQLHLYHCKLEKSPNGFAVVEDVTSTPRQLGLVLEHRLVHNRLYRDTQQAMHLNRMAQWFDHFRHQLFASSNSDPRQTFGVVLSQGIDGEGYDEHAYLAHYLGLPIVQSEDLVVRQRRIYLKNLGALQRVNFILRRVPEMGLDPLEMEDESPYGIPGLIDVLRHQNVFMDALPGAGILEKRVLFQTMPQLCQFHLKENLILPQLESPQSSNFDPWPSIQNGVIDQQSYQLLLTMSSFLERTQVMPGGLATSTLAGDQLPNVKDIWVCGVSSIPSELSPNQQLSAPSHSRNIGLPSRVADATLWFGRYLERSDSLCRILREILMIPSREHQDYASENQNQFLNLVQESLEITDTSLNDPNWEQRWTKMASDSNLAGSLHYNLKGIQRNAYILQDRISTDMLNLVEGLTLPYSNDAVNKGERESTLTRTLENLSAITGLSIDSMTHCDEWHFLLIGRRLERAYTTLALLKALYKNQSLYGEDAWELMLRTFDSIMTYRWRYHIQFNPSSILSMMIHDETNPRSIAFQVHDMIDTLKNMVAKGSLWAIGPSIHLKNTLDIIEALTYEVQDEDPSRFTNGMNKISVQLMNFYDDITKTLLHL